MSPEDPPTDDDAIREIVVRLARPHPRGSVIERAAILAEGPRSAAIVEWIVAHDGEPEGASTPAATHGLHGARDAARRGPQRYVLPAGALS